MVTKIVVAFAIVVNFLWVFVGCGALASAQAIDVPPVPQVRLTPPEGLRRGQAAPHDGLFVEVPTYLGLVAQIEGLEARIVALVERERARCEGLVGVERARLSAATEVSTHRDRLWQQRQAELLATIEATRESAVRQWYEQPIMWFILGAALAGALVGIVAASL